MVTIGHIKFRNLLGREYDELAKFLDEHPDKLTGYVDNLVADLTSTSTADLVDAEHIYIIGLRHYNHFSAALLERIDALVEAAAPERVAKIFHDVTRSEHQSAPIVASARQKLRDHEQITLRDYKQLESTIGTVPFDGWQRRARALMETRRKFAEQTGDAELLQRAGGGLANALLRAASKYGMPGLHFAEEMILECLRWNPFSGVLWVLWANVYFVARDVQSAELILWESLKRLPYNAFNSSTLCEILSRSGDLDTSIAVIEDAIIYSPDNGVLWNQLSKLLLRTNKEDNFDKLAFAAKRSVALRPSSIQDKILLANIILSLAGQKKIEDRLAPFLESLHKSEEWLLDVGLIITTRSNSQDISEQVFELLTGLFPKSARVANLYAKVVARRGDQAALDRAIEICRRTIQELEDNVYSRMQLITYLILKGDEDSLEKATKELDWREAGFGVDDHSKRLRQLSLRRVAGPEEKSSLLKIPSPIARETDQSRLLPQMAEPASFQLRLPRQVSTDGELRKLEFAIRKAGPDSLTSRAKLKAIIATNPTFAYAQLLAERHADWIRSDSQIDSFPAAFERALRSRDRALLTRLGAKHPKLEALCIVARSLIGDEAAFDQVSATLATIRGTEFPPLATLDRAITRIVSGTKGTVNLAKLSIPEQEQVREILYSANEASLM
jgi:tetratricopeptide (TPR) repeat protein